MTWACGEVALTSSPTDRAGCSSRACDCGTFLVLICWVPPDEGLPKALAHNGANRTCRARACHCALLNTPDRHFRLVRRRKVRRLGRHADRPDRAADPDWPAARGGHAADRAACGHGPIDCGPAARPFGARRALARGGAVPLSQDP